jgi:hypothetical protein
MKGAPDLSQQNDPARCSPAEVFGSFKSLFCLTREMIGMRRRSARERSEFLSPPSTLGVISSCLEYAAVSR